MNGETFSETFSLDKILTMIKEEMVLISPPSARQRITLDTQLADIGLDSVDTSSLVAQLEKRTSANIPDGALGYVNSIRDLAELLISHRDPHAGSQQALTPTDTAGQEQSGR